MLEATVLGRLKGRLWSFKDNEQHRDDSSQHSKADTMAGTRKLPALSTSAQ